MFILCLLISLLSPFSFAQMQQEQNVDNVAAVVWAAENIEQNTPDLMSKLFLMPGTAFFVKQENYFTIDSKARFPHDFVDKVEFAVDRITDKNNPTLVVDLYANCAPEALAFSKETTKHKDIISYDDFLDKLFKSSFNKNKHIKLMLFLDACSSDAIIPKIKEKLSCIDDEKQECLYTGLDGNKYKYQISVYTTSNNGVVKSEFLKTLTFISKLENCKNQKGYGLNNNGILTFLSLDKINYHSFWSSFSGINEKLASQGNVNVIIKLLNSDDSDVSGFVFETLVAKVKNTTEKETIISTLIDVLKNEKSSVGAYLRASIILMDVAKGNNLVIDALIDIIKDSKAEKKRRTNAISTLGSIAKENEIVIKTFIAVLESDKNDEEAIEDKSYAIVVLGEIAEGNIDAINAIEKTIKDQKENGYIQREDEFNKFIKTAEETLEKIKQR